MGNKIEILNSDDGPKPIRIGILANLKPAAAKLIESFDEIKMASIIKLTLLDLAFKQVIKIRKIRKEVSNYDAKKRVYSVVEAGKLFNDYIADSFEYYFLSLLDHNSYFQLKPYLKKVAENLPSDYECYRQIIANSTIEHLFKDNFFYRSLHLLQLNAEGKRIKFEIKNTIESLDLMIVDFITNKPKEAQQLINLLKGNIFLLKKMDFEILDQLQHNFSALNDDDSNYSEILDLLYLSNDRYIILDLLKVFKG